MDLPAARSHSRMVESLLQEKVRARLMYNIVQSPGRDDLGVGGLADDGADGVGVAGQGVDVDLAPHVPDPGGGVPAARHEHVQRGVEGQVIDGREVAVVVPDHLVVLKVPAFHLEEQGLEMAEIGNWWYQFGTMVFSNWHFP